MPGIAKAARKPLPRGPVLASWIPGGHALHLNKTIRQRIRRQFDPRGIFLNIPYSRRYSDLEVAILSTLTAYHMTPRMARERMRMEIRLLKIVELMLTCRYGLTDVSYATRMNMPLELGLLLAFGKETFVMSRRRYSALRTASDLNFCDIHYHEGSVRRLMDGLSRWVEEVCSPRRFFTTRELLRRYRRWKQIRQKLGDIFDRLKPEEIAKLVEVAQEEFKMELFES